MKRISAVLSACLLAVVFAGTVVADLTAEAKAEKAALEDAQTAQVRGDYATALRLWRMFADRGNIEAQKKLAWMYEQGYGVPQSKAEADKWYCRAAEQGKNNARFGEALLTEAIHRANRLCGRAAQTLVAQTLYVWTWKGTSASGPSSSLTTAWIIKCGRLGREAGAANVDVSFRAGYRVSGQPGFDPDMEDRGIRFYHEWRASCIALMPDRTTPPP